MNGVIELTQAHVKTSQPHVQKPVPGKESKAWNHLMSLEEEVRQRPRFNGEEPVEEISTKSKKPRSSRVRVRPAQAKKAFKRKGLTRSRFCEEYGISEYLLNRILVGEKVDPDVIEDFLIDVGATREELVDEAG